MIKVENMNTIWLTLMALCGLTGCIALGLKEKTKEFSYLSVSIVGSMQNDYKHIKFDKDDENISVRYKIGGDTVEHQFYISHSDFEELENKALKMKKPGKSIAPLYRDGIDYSMQIIMEVNGKSKFYNYSKRTNKFNKENLKLFNEIFVLADNLILKLIEENN